MHQQMLDVFEPIFFHYPDGLKHRSVWQPRDTRKYIQQWQKLASMRTRVEADAAATEHGEPLSKDQVSQIFKYYMEELKAESRPYQRGKNWKYFKR